MIMANTFVKIDTDLFLKIQGDKNISAQSKLIYFVYLSYCYGDKKTCWPTQEQVAEVCGVTDRTVRSCTKQLIDNGYITVKHRKCASGISNEYTINPVTTTTATQVTTPPQEPPQEPQYETKAREYEVVNPVTAPSQEPQEKYDRAFFQQKVTAYNQRLCTGFTTMSEEQLAEIKKNKEKCERVLYAMDQTGIYDYKHLCTAYDNAGKEYDW